MMYAIYSRSGPCALLIWNQGSQPPPLGKSSVSANPVYTPNIRLTYSQFRKQHFPDGGHMILFRKGERTLFTLGRTRPFRGQL